MAKEIQLDENGKRKFGILDSISYAAGDFGCNMSFALKSTLIIFWTQFMKMDSILYALLLIIVQVWDAINDPLIGSIIDADKRKYKRNKFLTYIWFGSIGLLVAGALCFLPIPNAYDWAKIIIFIAGYVVWDAFYTIANVPYGSLLSLISNDTADRASLSAWRSIGSILGNMVPMVILPMIIYDQNNNIVGMNVFLAALIMGVLGFISFQFMIRTTEIRVEEDLKVSEEAPKVNILVAFKNFMLNRPAVGATLAAMGMFIGMQGAATAVTVLFQSYFKNVQVSGIIQLFSMIPIVIFTPLARKMVTKYGKKELSTVGAICSVVAGVLMLILPITPTVLGMVLYVVCQLIYSLGLGIYSTVSWALMGDAIDYNEWKTGTREEGVVYSLHSFFRKLAQGAGPSIVLVIMAALGYSEYHGGNQTFLVALNMRYLVAALYLLAAVMQFVGLALIYNLDKKTLAQMNKDLGRDENGNEAAAEAVEAAEAAPALETVSEEA
ncbi:MAG: MFS transporter [Clostridia bacterium]|nr:MFS transporter [Clostridia bacterium]